MKLPFKIKNPTEFLKKLRPKKIKIPDGISYRGWVGANMAAGFLLILFLFQIVSSYSEKGEQAVLKGKRVIISIPTDDIEMRDPVKEKAEETAENITEKHEELQKQEVEKEVAGQAPASQQTSISTENPKLSIIISNLGLNKSVANAAINLPPEISLSFSPYADNVNDFVQNAKTTGHEVFMDLPMEMDDYPLSDPGPFALLTSFGKARNIFRLKSALDTAQGYVGVLSPTNESVTHSLLSIIPIIDEIKKYGILFIYKEKPSNRFLEKEARAIGVSTISNYVLIDEIPTKEAIDKKLDEITKMVAEEKKTVLAVGNSYPLTIKRVELWAQMQKENKNSTKISPVSDMVKK